MHKEKDKSLLRGLKAEPSDAVRLRSKTKYNPVCLYRIWNTKLHRYGEPFALCNAHRETVPSNVCIVKIAKWSLIPCDECKGWPERKRTAFESRVGLTPKKGAL